MRRRHRLARSADRALRSDEASAPSATPAEAEVPARLKRPQTMRIWGMRADRAPGQAMIIVVIVALLLLTLPLVLYAANSGSQPVVTNNVNTRLAMAAARSGLADYQNQLNQNTNFASYNNNTNVGPGYAGGPPIFNYPYPTSPVLGPGPGQSSLPLTPSCAGAYEQDATGPGGSGYTDPATGKHYAYRIIDWQPVKDTTSPACEHYSISVDGSNLTPSSTATSASVTVTVTGEAGIPPTSKTSAATSTESYQAISETLTAPSHNYAFSSNYNASNPDGSAFEMDVNNVLIPIVKYFDPSLLGMLGQLGGIQKLVDLLCVRYAGEPFFINNIPILGTVKGPFPGCPVQTWEAGWSWSGIVTSPDWSQQQDVVNGNIKSNDGIYYCGFPPQHLVNWIQLGIQLFTASWGQILIDALLLATFDLATNNLSPVSPVFNGNVTAGVATTGGGYGQSEGVIPGLPQGALSSILATAAGWPSCPSTPAQMPAGQPTLNSSLLPLPQPNPNLEGIAAGAQKSVIPGSSPPQSAYGCVYVGPTVMVLNNDGTMTVWNPDTVGSNSTLLDGCPTSGGTAKIPSDGVVYDANVTQGGCQSFPNPPFSALNYGYGTNQSTPIQSFPWPPTQIQGSPGFVGMNHACTDGDIMVQGTLQGQLTIAAQDNVVITNSIYYAGPGCPGAGSAQAPTGTCQTMLGLTAQGDVEINHPQNQGYNNAQHVLAQLSGYCNIILGILGILSYIGIGLPFAAFFAVVCGLLIPVAQQYLLETVGANANDCPNSGFNSCSTYNNDDDTSNPNVLYPDNNEPLFRYIDHPGDLLNDLFDGTIDVVSCGECTVVWNGCANWWGHGWCWSITIWCECWTDVTGESDNPNMNGGTWNFGSLWGPDGDNDEVCIPDPFASFSGALDAIWDWVWNGSRCGGPGDPNWFLDRAVDSLSPDTNFPAFYGLSGQQAVVNADILTVGAQNPSTGAYPSVTAGSPAAVCPTYNQDCGMFMTDNPDTGFSMGTLTLNGSVTEYYGGQLTGECQSLANLANTISSTLPFLNCLSNSGYFVHMNFDQRLLDQSPPYFYGASTPAGWAQLLWQPSPTMPVHSNAEIALGV